MSVIINMLKDLDRREKRNPSLPDISLNSADEDRSLLSYLKLSINGKWSFILSLLAVMSIAVVTTSLRYKFNHTTISVKPFLKDEVSHGPDKKVADAVTAPAQISSMTIQPDTTSAEMHFNIDSPFLYHITSTLNNHFLITFENTNLASSLPAVDLSNMLIKSIKTIKTGSDTQFDFVLNPGWHLVALDTSEHNGSHDLKIQFTAPRPAAKTVEPAKPFVSTTTPAITTSTTTAVNAVKTPVSEDQLNVRYQAALNTAEAGDKETAINMLSGILYESKLYHQARTSLIALLMDTGNFMAAEKSIKSGLILAPDYLPYIELRARLLMMQNDISGAIDLLQQYAPSINEYPDFYAFLAALYERSNKDSLAANIYRQLVQVDSSNGRWWFGLALALDKAGNQKEAGFAYSKALSKGKLSSETIAYLHKRLQVLQEANNNDAT